MHVLVVGENRQTAAAHCQTLQAAGFPTGLVAPPSSNPGCNAEPVEPSQSYAAVVILCDSGAVGRARSPPAPSGPPAPSCSGHCPLQQFRALGNQLPVLVIAAHASMEAQVNCLEAGADDYLAAPYEPSVLRARLRALIRRSRQTDDPVLQV